MRKTRLTPYEQSKIKKGQCIVFRCTKPNKSGHYCYAHRQALARKKDPVKYAYYDLKSNARRRGKVFALTLEQFRRFAVEVEFFSERGRKSKSYHIDRIDENKGYTIDNIQLITNAENIKKFRTQSQHGYTTVTQINQSQHSTEKAPF